MITTEIRVARFPARIQRFRLNWAGFVLIGVMLVLGGCAWGVSPDVLTIRVTGRANGIGSSSQSEALQSAQREAVTQYLHTLVPSDDPTLPPSLEPVLRHFSQYATACHVLRCDESGENTRIEADVTLSEDALRYDVATLMLPRLREKPKVLLVLGEMIGKDQIPAVLPDSVVERTFFKGMEQFHLAPLGVKTLDDRFIQQVLVEAVTGNVAASTSFSSHTDYDAVVVGSSLTTVEQGAGGGIPRISATTTVRVHRGRDGAMTGQTSGTAAVYSPYLESGGEQAVQDATTRVLRKTAVDCVIATLGRQTQERVLLTVEKPGTEVRVQAVMELIQSVPGVSSVQVLFLETDRCRIRIGYSGPMADLTDAVSGLAFAGAPLKIQSVLLREISATFE